MSERLKLVPFNPVWIGHDKIDIKGIYRRPRFKQDQYGEWEREYDDQGNPTWDLTGGLPIKQHVRWESKGFEYVTLADKPSLLEAARFGTILDETGQPTANWRMYDQHQTTGPWSYKKYAESQLGALTLSSEQLVSDIEEFGWETVERLRRRSDPGFRVPEHMKKPKRAGVEVGKKGAA